MQIVANDKIHVRSISNIICENEENLTTFSLSLRCDECISAGLTIFNDKRTDDQIFLIQKSREQEQEQEKLIGAPSLDEELVLEAEIAATGTEVETEEEEEEQRFEESISIPKTCFCSEIPILKFQDSYRIVPGSLSELVDTLRSKKIIRDCICDKVNNITCLSCIEELQKIFPHTSKFVASTCDLKYLNFHLEKGVFPHELIKSKITLNEITSFPSIDNFKNTLNGNEISLESWEKGKKMWHLQKCETLEDYSKVYLQVCKFFDV